MTRTKSKSKRLKVLKDPLIQFCPPDELVINPVTKEPYFDSKTDDPFTYEGVPLKYQGLIESPMEARFIKAIAKYSPELIPLIEAQKVIDLDSGYSFRADFAVDSKMLLIEVDGATYHNRLRDGERDYLLSEAGWEVMRFRHLTVSNVRKKSIIKTNHKLANEPFFERNGLAFTESGAEQVFSLEKEPRVLSEFERRIKLASPLPKKSSPLGTFHLLGPHLSKETLISALAERLSSDDFTAESVSALLKFIETL